jgi:endogenous inhibitor of DNA gyrase (YacG/DUF329 family)
MHYIILSDTLCQLEEGSHALAIKLSDDVCADEINNTIINALYQAGIYECRNCGAFTRNKIDLDCFCCKRCSNKLTQTLKLKGWLKDKGVIQ